MAAFKDLLKRVTDVALRGQLEEEYKRALKNKKFGLVFEEHRPEFTSLYGVELKEGMSAVLNGVKNAAVLQVLSVADGIASCYNATEKAMEDHSITDLVAVAKFEDPIFPVLTPVDEIENAPGDPLWHTLIQADNYHALQLLEYMYRGKVDCIYIDPPYNTGARDWKYNNDYVDSTDYWRHSKWLSMMSRRLTIASNLLKPEGVMIITIDDNELAHLTMLVDDIFRDRKQYAVAIQHNPRGSQGEKFAVSHETAIYIVGRKSEIYRRSHLDGDSSKFRKWGNQSERSTTSRAKTFFPVIVDENLLVVGFGDVVDVNDHSHAANETVDGKIYVYPIDGNGVERKWRYSKANEPEVLPLLRAVRVDGTVEIEIRRDSENTLTVWTDTLYNAEEYGTKLVNKIVGDSFSYPKSLYAERDSMWHVVAGKKDALIVDFFAGSGTTLHAVNLLNAEDGGKRRCIMVTNNEVSAKEEDQLLNSGHKPGDDAWEALGIAKHVTWPRTRCSILGQNITGAPLTGEYQTNIPCEKKLPRTYYHLGFVKDFSGLSSEQKKKIVDMIGVPAGVKKLLKEIKDFPDSAQKVLSGAAMPKGEVDADCKFVVSDESTSSILFDDSAVDDWIEALGETDRVTDLYIVTEKKRKFNEIKAKVSEALGEVVVAATKAIPMAEGFKANAKFFKLDFVDKDSVRLGRQFKGILPILWMRSGAKGKCPVWNKAGEPDMFIRPENGFAVLVKYDKYSEFIETVNADPKITDVYFVTNSESDYREMCQELKRGKKPTHLYHSYLENFVIGCRRNAK